MLFICKILFTASKATNIIKLRTGEKIDEDRWFKGIIFIGKLALTAIPPGRASEFEKYRRTVIEQKGKATEKNRKSCRIATELDYGFERVRKILFKFVFR
jgi:hypothetical protein